MLWAELVGLPVYPLLAGSLQQLQSSGLPASILETTYFHLLAHGHVQACVILLKHLFKTNFCVKAS